MNNKPTEKELDHILKQEKDLPITTLKNGEIRVIKSGKTGQRYPVVSDGEAMEVNWRTHDFKMQCCDCGLVHRLRFTVIKSKLRIRGWRDNRATGQARRRIKKEKDAIKNS